MGKSELKKNLLLIHLESLNLLNYRMNPDLFPVVREMGRRGITFDRYYSTATSTLMVIGDLLYGGMMLYEGCDTLATVPQKYCYQSSLFDDLKEQGYDTGLYIYPDGADRESAEARHIAGFHNRMELVRGYSEYLGSIERRMDRQPFAVMACNYISNLSFGANVDINRYGMDTDYWTAGYRCLDCCCGDLLRLLKDKKRIEDTVIVLYGDHGDDYWGHGMHKGLTHAIEPNNLLIHTPLIILDGVPREKAEHDHRLVQTTDLRRMIMALLSGKTIDDLPSRQYAFSRNEYAAQPVRGESFNKAYSITEGRYLLMVSGKGMEMYDTKMDSACQNNVLRFFSYGDGILKSNVIIGENLRFHFSSFWNSREQRILRNKFYELKSALYGKTLELYTAGGRDEKDMLGEMSFGEIAY